MAWKGSGVRVPSAPPPDGGLHLQAAVFRVRLSRAGRSTRTRRYGVIVAARIAGTSAVATVTPSRDDGSAPAGRTPHFGCGGNGPPQVPSTGSPCAQLLGGPYAEINDADRRGGGRTHAPAGARADVEPGLGRGCAGGRPQHRGRARGAGHARNRRGSPRPIRGARRLLLLRRGQPAVRSGLRRLPPQRRRLAPDD